MNQHDANRLHNAAAILHTMTGDIRRAIETGRHECLCHLVEVARDCMNQIEVIRACATSEVA